MNKLSYLLLITFSSIILSGCHSSKDTVSPSSGNINNRGSLTEIVSKTPVWSDVEVPVNIEISSPVNFNISGRAKMVRGKVVDISFRMLGFEVGRIYADTDSIFGYVKMSKMCIAESIGDLTAQVPMNISNIQDLLTGTLFLLGQGVLSDAGLKDFSIETEINGTMLIPKRQSGAFQYGFFVDNENHVSRFVGGNESKNIQFVADYADYSPIKGLSGNVGINVSLKRPVIASINWRWESAKWNAGIMPGFSMPRGYKRVRSQELINNLPK